MTNYRPQLNNTIPLILYVPTVKSTHGVAQKTYEKGPMFYGSFKTYGGTERVVNGVYAVIDTATVETWYRPDITSECRIQRASDGAMFEIINEPENIGMRNQFLKFKVRRVKGGV